VFDQVSGNPIEYGARHSPKRAAGEATSAPLLLMARDGTERVIIDARSGKYAELANGSGTLLVFRDHSVEAAREKDLQHAARMQTICA
jgi:hypothetical protein